MTTTAPNPTGTIHDLGYEPYAGPRLAQRRRFLVIARNVAAIAWRSRWGVKVPILLTALVTIGAATAMTFADRFGGMKILAGGKPLLPTTTVLFTATGIYGFLAFLLAAAVGWGAVADDMKTGAFQFYFSRPLRVRDYVAGKLCGVCLVVGMPMLVGPLLLALFHLALADGGAALVHDLPLVARTAAVGLVATLVYALVPLGIGALVRRRAPAQALFVVVFLVVSGIAKGMAQGLRMPTLGLLSITADVEAVVRAIYGIDRDPAHPPALLAALALAALGALSLAIVYRRVAAAETTGIGGGS